VDRGRNGTFRTVKVTTLPVPGPRGYRERGTGGNGTGSLPRDPNPVYPLTRLRSGFNPGNPGTGTRVPVNPGFPPVPRGTRLRG